MQVFGRLVRGMPADILWRFEEESLRSRRLVVVVATIRLALAASLLVLFDTMRASTLPMPPPAGVPLGAPAGALPLPSLPPSPR